MSKNGISSPYNYTQESIWWLQNLFIYFKYFGWKCVMLALFFMTHFPLTWELILSFVNGDIEFALLITTYFPQVLPCKTCKTMFNFWCGILYGVWKILFFLLKVFWVKTYYAKHISKRNKILHKSIVVFSFSKWRPVLSFKMFRSYKIFQIKFFSEIKCSIKDIVWILENKYGTIRICSGWYVNVSLFDLFLSLLPHRNMRKPEVFYSRGVKKVRQAPCAFGPLSIRIFS